MEVKVKKLHTDSILPQRQTHGSAGADLCAYINNTYGMITIQPSKTVKIHTGVAFSMPSDTVGFIFARSGIAAKNDLALINGVGVIDEDYRGEIIVPLHNYGAEPKVIKHGERIAQFVLSLYKKAVYSEIEMLDETERGDCGFGSTGTTN